MAAEISDSRECPHFCAELLSDLPSDLQEKVVSVLHDLLEKRFVDAFSMCETLLNDIRGTFEIDPPHYKMILNELCFALLKVEESESAEKLAEQQLEHLKKDFLTLLTLGMIHDNREKHENALEVYQQANVAAVQNDDILQDAVSLLKLAICYWNLGQLELSRQLIDKSQRAFQQLPAEENKLRSIDSYSLVKMFYKNMAYLNKLTNEHAKATANYLKALDTIRSGSAGEELTLLSELSLCFAHSNDKFAVDRNNERALTIVQDLKQNSQVLSAHCSQILNILWRLGQAYSLVKNLKASLEIHEMMLEMAMTCLGMAHPRVAKIAIDIAILCWKLRQIHRIVELENTTEKCLKECDYKNDEAKMKLYGQDIINALSSYAYLYSIQRKYSLAKEKSKEA